MENYDKGTVLGRGTFGSVFKAVHKKGIHVTALREIKLLKELQHDYIIRLIDVFPHKRNLTLVFEYMESDLEAVITDPAIVLSEADIKSYMLMLLKALAFCHSHWVLHRDIKPNNMLLAPTGELKLADFGLARVFGSPERKYTFQVYALWYRPPELLYGSSCYTSAVDVWATGCVFAELLLRRPWLKGTGDIDQLGKIFQALGTPTPERWPGVQDLPSYVEFVQVPTPTLRSQFPQASEDALDLLSGLVALDPSRRLTAEQALAHRFFSSAPPPTPPSRLARPQTRESNPLQMAALPVVHIQRPTVPRPERAAGDEPPQKRQAVPPPVAASR